MKQKTREEVREELAEWDRQQQEWLDRFESAGSMEAIRRRQALESVMVSYTKWCESSMTAKRVRTLADMMELMLKKLADLRFRSHPTPGYMPCTDAEEVDVLMQDADAVIRKALRR